MFFALWAESARGCHGREVVKLETRLAALGEQLTQRELKHREALADARECADGLHRQVEEGLAGFHASVEEAAPHLRIALGEPRVDDKHLHSVQFDLARGRYRAIVTVKSRGEITLVGPFRDGKTEGPCRTFPMPAGDAVAEALEEFLVAFIEEAATP